MIINARIEDNYSVNEAEYLLLSEKKNSVKIYGVAVRYRDEFSVVRDISTERSTADRIFKAVVDGFVMPVTLADVIENLLVGA